MKERRSKERLEADSVLLKLEEKSDEALRRILDELYIEEEQISCRRRMLHGKIDILRTELTRRLSDKHGKDSKSIISETDINRLTRILSQALTDGPKPERK